MKDLADDFFFMMKRKITKGQNVEACVGIDIDKNNIKQNFTDITIKENLHPKKI